MDGLRGTLEDLSPLTALQTLRCYGCNSATGDIAVLVAGMPSLEVVSLVGVIGVAGDLAALAGMTLLRTLQVAGTGVHGDPAVIRALPQMGRWGSRRGDFSSCTCFPCNTQTCITDSQNAAGTCGVGCSADDVAVLTSPVHAVDVPNDPAPSWVTANGLRPWDQVGAACADCVSGRQQECRDIGENAGPRMNSLIREFGLIDYAGDSDIQAQIAAIIAVCGPGGEPPTTHILRLRTLLTDRRYIVGFAAMAPLPPPPPPPPAANRNPAAPTSCADFGEFTTFSGLVTDACCTAGVACPPVSTQAIDILLVVCRTLLTEIACDL